MAPRKVRSVGDLIKGLPVDQAEAQLMVQTRRPAKPLLKLLRSAVANAKNNGKLEASHLFVQNVRVDGGPMLHRMLARARGSGSEIQKKMSHVTLTLGVNPALKPKFKIVIQKKAKLPPSEDRRVRSKKPKMEEPAAPEPKKKPGFWKRTFSRKSISK